jgi:hypothetical protein
MEEILELIHNEFIESEEYYVFLRRLEEEKENIDNKTIKTLVKYKTLTKFV